MMEDARQLRHLREHTFLLSQGRNRKKRKAAMYGVDSMSGRQELVKADPEVVKVRPLRTKTPLMWAAMGGYLEVSTFCKAERQDGVLGHSRLSSGLHALGT
jgi:hypothetical protein